MSWPDPDARRGIAPLRTIVALLAGLAVVFVAGCSVQPLYGNSTAGGGQAHGMASELASIAVAPVETRQAQQVRNHLIFLLTGGQAQPTEPRYTLTLGVTTTSSPAAQIQRASEFEPTSQIVTMTARYSLVESTTRRIVASGTRRTVAAYDVSRQEFAALRAERDAQNRAGRELAELLRMAIAQQLARPGTTAILPDRENPLRRDPLEILDEEGS